MTDHPTILPYLIFNSVTSFVIFPHMPLMSTVVLSASTQGLIVLIFVYSSFFELEFVCLFVFVFKQMIQTDGIKFRDTKKKKKKTHTGTFPLPRSLHMLYFV